MLLRSIPVRMSIPIATMLILASLAACDPAPGSGSVLAFWHLGSKSCQEAGIASIRIRILSDGGDLVSPVPAECADGGAGVAIPDVPAGRRQVVVEGLDDQGVPRYDGSSDDVVVLAGQEVIAPSVALGLRRAAVRVRWGFKNSQVCGSNGVATIRLAAFDQPGNLVAGPDLHPCDVPLDAADPEGGAVLSGLPANTDLVLVVLAFSIVERPIFGASVDLRVLPGDTADQAVLLEKCEAGAPCP